MFLPIWNYLKGYVIIKASGLSAGKFINMAAYYGVDLWDIRNDGKNYFIKARMADVDELKEISRKSGCRTEVIKYRGIPFLVKKYKKRRAFIFGCVFFIFYICSMSLFVWRVKVEGNYRVAGEDIKNFCASQGLRAGVLKNDVDLNKISNDIIAQFGDIAWASVNIDGSEAIISISETIPETEIIDNSEPCDIISQYDGIIESIMVAEGTPTVSAGDIVKKGDMLVSGRLSFKDGEEEKGYTYVKSDAYIRARTVHRLSFSVDKRKNEKEYTGNSSISVYISVFGNEYGFGMPNNFENCDYKLRNDIGLSIGDYKIPFGLKIYNAEEYILKEALITKEEADIMAKDVLLTYGEENFGFDAYVISQDLNGSDEGDRVNYTAVLEVSHKIGQEVPCSEQ